MAGGVGAGTTKQAGGGPAGTFDAGRLARADRWLARLMGKQRGVWRAMWLAEIRSLAVWLPISGWLEALAADDSGLL